MTNNRNPDETLATEETNNGGLPMDAFSVRMRNYTAPDPSPRNPQISRESSHPDRIEQRMAADGHRVWGFVIYRTTYDSDPDWAEFLRRLRFRMQDEMDFYNGQDILDLFQLTVFDDRALFDGADAATIRGHFQQWAETAYREEQRRGIDASGGEQGEVRMGLSPRYRYCVHVDAEALRSVVHLAPPPEQGDLSATGWVRLINKNWVPRSEHPMFRHRPRDPQVYDAIEGITEEDMGWVKCPYHTVMVLMYVRLEDVNGWALIYRRPPAVVDAI